MEIFAKAVNNQELLTIFTKKLRLWCLTRLWIHLCTPKLIYYIKIKTEHHIYIWNKALNLKAYNKARRATNIISHSLSERKSIFNASLLWKLSNVTQHFTASRVRSGTLQGMSGTCGTAPNSPAFSAIILFKTGQGLEC